MNGLPYDPKRPGGLPWAARRIQKIREREQREAAQRRRRSARKDSTRQEPAMATGPRTVPSEYLDGTVDDAFLADWGRGGLLDPALWARGTQLTAPTAAFGTTGGALRSADPPPAVYWQAAAAAPVPAPFPVPLPLPPVFIPGTPENKAFTDSTIRFYNWLKRSLPGSRGKDADCTKEWEDAYRICDELLTRGGGSRNLTGGYTNLHDCAKGFVSERCGGNAVDRGGRRPTR